MKTAPRVVGKVAADQPAAVSAGEGGPTPALPDVVLEPSAPVFPAAIMGSFAVGILFVATFGVWRAAVIPIDVALSVTIASALVPATVWMFLALERLTRRGADPTEGGRRNSRLVSRGQRVQTGWFMALVGLIFLISIGFSVVSGRAPPVPEPDRFPLVDGEAIGLGALLVVMGLWWLRRGGLWTGRLELTSSGVVPFQTGRPLEPGKKIQTSEIEESSLAVGRVADPGKAPPFFWVFRSEREGVCRVDAVRVELAGASSDEEKSILEWVRMVHDEIVRQRGEPSEFLRKIAARGSAHFRRW